MTSLIAEVLADSPAIYQLTGDDPNVGYGYDSSGNGRSATAGFGTYTQPTDLHAPPPGRPVTFTAGSFSFGEADWLTGSAGTWECWIKATANTYAWTKHGTTPVAGSMQVNTNAISFELSTSVTGYQSSSWTASGVHDGRWHHVVVVYNGSTLVAYLDGAACALIAGGTQSGTITANDAANRLGCLSVNNTTGNGPTGSTSASFAHCAIYTTALSAERVAAHYNATRNAATTYADLILGTPACAAYFPLTDAASPYADQRADYDASVTSTVTAQNRALGGSLGTVTDFAGGYLTGSDSDLYSAAGTGAAAVLSVEAWIIPDTFGSAMMIVSKGNPSGSTMEWDLRLTTNGGAILSTQTPAASGAVLEPTAPDGSLVAGQLAHIVATYDRAGSTSSIYVNGVLVGTDTSVGAGGSMTAGSAALMIGRRADGGGQVMDGAIGHVAIYHRVLTAAEVGSHYRCGVSPAAIYGLSSY